MLAALAAARFAHDAACILLFGLIVFPFSVGEASSRPARWVSALAIVAPLTALAELLVMTANMGGTFASAFDPGTLAAAATDTEFGRVWLARLALAIILAPLAVRTPRTGAVLSALLLASIALTGHSAMPGGALGALHMLADAAHLLAAGWWIGGLLALILAGKAVNTAMLQRFSGIGYVAVTTILVSGVFKSWILIGSWPPLVGTDYGRLLLAKIALFLAMGAVALLNRFWITPALARGAAPEKWLQRLKRQVGVEFALGLGVLGLVGVLGAISPPIAL